MPKRRNLLFLIVIIISFILMTYQSKKGRILSGSFINDLLNVSHLTAASLTDAFKRPFKRLALREEQNKRLEEYVGELLMERGRYQEAVLENKRLRELLKLKGNRENYIVSAKVIARGIDQWANTLLMDKGIRDGVAKDMCAVTPKGLAGKIFNVTDSYSNLLLITDINFSAAVRTQESRREGIISGSGTKKCILKYMPYEEEIKTGDVVVTSGLDLLFPPGIPVGYVSRVDNRGKGGNFQYIEVIPFQDDAKMEEVVIVR